MGHRGQARRVQKKVHFFGCQALARNFRGVHPCIGRGGMSGYYNLNTMQGCLVSGLEGLWKVHGMSGQSTHEWQLYQECKQLYDSDYCTRSVWRGPSPWIPSGSLTSASNTRPCTGGASYQRHREWSHCACRCRRYCARVVQKRQSHAN